MVHRRFWIDRVEEAWRDRSVIWLSGVRRVGKTCLCQSLPGVDYFDCELPRVRRELEDPEAFLSGVSGSRVVLDEIHRLRHPTQLLKIAADHYPDTHVLATGSSTLAATTKFRDTLAGRKRDIWLTPMIAADLVDFGRGDLDHRFLRGGLPPFFLASAFPERDFQEWMDAFWAKDIQELFRLERRSSFLRFIELVLTNSGGIFEATAYARPCEVSRTTISNYLNVLSVTHVAHVVRPFSQHRPTEIVAAPKVYGFDTGFVAYHRGWDALRPEDKGTLWEHFVLNEINAVLRGRPVNYWRDKRGHEVDFVYVKRGRPPTVIECKWSADAFEARNLLAFRRQYPEGENYLVAHDVERAYSRRFSQQTVKMIPLSSLSGKLQGLDHG
jgi:predicted AAA+ superfamily ATPase